MFDDDDDNNNDDDFVGTGTTTNFYYLHLKIVLSKLVLRPKLTIQPHTELRRLTKGPI